MGNHRMFSNTIIDSDLFLEMPLSTQALYFHLCMRADDEGFIGNPKKIIRAVSCTEDDLRLLIAKKFVICFDSGILVVIHWHLHNQIRKDRRKDTFFQNEKALITLEKGSVYALRENLSTKCQPSDNQMSAQGKVSKEKLIQDNIYIAGHSPTSYSVFFQIVDYLNKKAGTSYKANSKSTQRHISARLNEGFTVADFTAVIDSKITQWKNDKNFSIYLRPETLFGTKFESYLNNAHTTSLPQPDYNEEF